MGRVIPAFSQFFDGEGVPLANGWLRFLVSNSNNTDKATFSDSLFQIANENPLQLDAEGRCPDVFGTGDYRVISYINDPEDEDSPGEQLQVFDPVTAQAEGGGSTGTGTVFDTWDALVTYSLGDIVTHDLLYYRSLINSNLGNDPSITSFAWEQVDFLSWWNDTISYEEGDLVYYLDNLWLSLHAVNQNNVPTSSPTYWRQVASGYKGVINNTGNYTITTSDRDYIIALTPAAIADATFDLPAMTANTSGFRLAIVNKSSFTVTIDAAGTTAIWLNSSGLLDIEGGALIELIYDSLCDCWTPLGNVGPVLGNQDIGTSSFPVHDIHADGVVTADTIVLTTSAIIPTLNADTIHIPSNDFLYFGDSDEVSLSYTSATPAFDLNVPTGAEYNFSVNSVEQWTMATTGEFLPGAANTAADIGASTNRVDDIFAENIDLPTSGILSLGDTDEMSIYYSGSFSFIDSSAQIRIRTTASEDINFFTNSSLAATIYPGGHFETVGDLFVGGYAQIGGASGVSIIRETTYNRISSGLELRFQYGSSDILILDTSLDANFYGNIVMQSNNNIFLNAASDAFIGYNSTADAVRFRTQNATTDFVFGTNSVDRWIMYSTGTFSPVTNNAYNLGTSTTRISEIYANALYSSAGPNIGISSGEFFKITNVSQGTNLTVTFQGYIGSTAYELVIPPA